MQWPRWRTKLPRNQTEDDPYATTGPNWERSPVAPPPNIPHPRQEKRDFEPSDTISARRWARIMRLTRRSMALLSLIWIMLPHEIRDLLINTIQR
jgi:hypothetical protein